MATGKPKGIVVSHSAFCSARQHQVDALCFHSEARVFDFASYSFDLAVYNAMMTLSVGACLCIPSEEQRNGSLNRTLQDMAATMVALTPSMSRLLEPENLPDLETLMLGGEAVSTADLKRLSGCFFRVLNAYGPAECTPLSTLNANPTTPGISTSIGTGIGALTWIVDQNDHTKLVTRGTIGELLLEGPTLAQGYLNEPEKTAAAFISDPPWLIKGASSWTGRRGRLYKTGDLVRYGADGSLEYIGRKDAQVKLRGQRIELGEVEHHVRRAMPLADQVFAELIELGGQKQKQMLAVFLTCQSGGGWCDPKPVTGAIELVRVDKDIETVFSQSLPAYMIPSLYFRVSAMPLTMTGKVHRGRLREMGSMLSAKRLVELRGCVPPPDSGRTGRNAGEHDDPQHRDHTAVVAPRQ
ncbi:nonribosomal peptide synthetase [Xylariales sp. AK1849]|nr:nonribosomal peptide synthetase [Xylariales sp. AK1849]